ncbi:hypothetical protein BVI2075_530065 [Burkholderia vietnamiensis]|nr:hypothetical protein BVI2075_530065 [Burkholderia vietnamiensis]
MTNPVFSMTYIIKTVCANDCAFPRPIKMFSEADKCFAGANPRETQSS